MCFYIETKRIFKLFKDDFDDTGDALMARIRTKDIYGCSKYEFVKH